MNVGLVGNTYSSITNGNGALQSARQNADSAKFSDLLNRLQNQDDGRGTVASDQIAERGRLNEITPQVLVVLLQQKVIKLLVLEVLPQINLILMWFRKQLTVHLNFMKNQWKWKVIS